MIAAFLGFWPAILTLFLGTLLATLYALYLLPAAEPTALTQLPFGSFLCVGGLIAALFGDAIIDWYTSPPLIASSTLNHAAPLAFA